MQRTYGNGFVNIPKCSGLACEVLLELIAFYRITWSTVWTIQSYNHQLYFSNRIMETTGKWDIMFVDRLRFRNERRWWAKLENSRNNSTWNNRVWGEEFESGNSIFIPRCSQKQEKKWEVFSDDWKCLYKTIYTWVFAVTLCHFLNVVIKP